MDQSSLLETSQTVSRTKRSFLVSMLIAISLLLSTLIYIVVSPRPMAYTKQALSLPYVKPILGKTEPTKLKEPTKDAQEWQYLTVHSGDSLSTIFKRAGLSSKTLQEVLSKNTHAKLLTSIKPNQEIQILAQNETLIKLIIPHSKSDSLIVERKAGHYVSEIKSRATKSQNKLITATVQGSLYGTAKRHNISFKLIAQMTAIFNREIDFARDIRAGDQFTILYKAYYIENELVNTGDILAVTYTHHGHVYQAIRHELGRDYSDYFTPEGKSLKQAFSRYPVQFSHISSMFSLSRMHPILRYKRPHQGVDLSAPLGTPIHATGDGRIETIEHHSTYGNVIKINHQNAYSSVYAHMHHFQKGLSRGSRVKRGQVIGYVGQTGLADGPHCHYEFRVNDLPINPSTVVLPRAASIPQHQLRSFKALSQNLLSQLKLYETASLATSNKKKTV